MKQLTPLTRRYVGREHPKRSGQLCEILPTAEKVSYHWSTVVRFADGERVVVRSRGALRRVQ